jgi:hypothetical protein
MDVQMQRAARGKRPKYFDDEAIDRCLSMVLALAQETWVMRERMAATEILLSRGEVVTAEVLDSYTPSREEALELSKRREIFLECILRRVQQDVEGLQMQGEGTDMDEVISSIASKS